MLQYSLGLTEQATILCYLQYSTSIYSSQIICLYAHFLWILIQSLTQSEILNVYGMNEIQGLEHKRLSFTQGRLLLL